MGRLRIPHTLRSQIDVRSDGDYDSPPTRLSRSIVRRVQQVSSRVLPVGVTRLRAGRVDELVVGEVPATNPLLEVVKLERAHESVDVLDDEHLGLKDDDHPDEFLPELVSFGTDLVPVETRESLARRASYDDIDLASPPLGLPADNVATDDLWRLVVLGPLRC